MNDGAVYEFTAVQQNFGSEQEIDDNYVSDFNGKLCS